MKLVTTKTLNILKKTSIWHKDTSQALCCRYNTSSLTLTQQHRFEHHQCKIGKWSLHLFEWVVFNQYILTFGSRLFTCSSKEWVLTFEKKITCKLHNSILKAHNSVALKGKKFKHKSTWLLINMITLS